MGYISTKPAVTNIKKQALILAAVLIPVLAGAAFFILRKPAEESVPQSIKTVSISVAEPEIETTQGQQAKTQLATASTQEMKKIEAFLQKYLDKAFIRKQQNNPKSATDLDNLISPSVSSSDMQGEPTTLSFPPLNKEILATLDGKSKLNNVVIAFNNDMTPALVLGDLTVDTKYLLKNEKDERQQLNISIAGQISLEPVGDEWRIVDLDIERKDSLYKLVEKEKS